MSAEASWRYHASGLTEVDPDDSWLGAAEAERIAAFRFEKRRTETRMSRWTAKSAVGHVLGLPVDDSGRHGPDELRRIAIRNAADGAPEALLDGEPAGVSVSMTDRADWAVCVVATDPSIAVGCDLELVEPRSAGFVDDWFTERERSMVASAGRDDHDVLANLVWSAKESGLKVLRTGLRRDTRSVEVRLETSAVVDGWGSLEVASLDAADAGAVFPGWWRRFGEFLLTCTASAPLDPPTAATEPPPLATAAPSHTWADRLRSR